MLHYVRKSCAIVFAQVCAVNSTLLILAVTLERYLAICWPLKSATWRTPRRAKLTVPTILVFSLFYNSPYLKTSGLSQNLLCAAVVKHDTGSKIWAWWGLVLNFAIPFFTLVTMNTFIVRAIHCRAKYLVVSQVKMKKTFARSNTRESIVNNLSLIRRPSNSFESPAEILSSTKASPKSTKKQRSERIHRLKNKMTSNDSKTNSHKSTDSDMEIEIALNINMVKERHNQGNDTEEGTTVVSSMLNVREGEANHSDSNNSHTNLGSRKSNETEGRHQRQLTIMLLVVTTAFLLLTSPQYIRYIIFSFLNITKDEQTFAFATLFYHLTNKLFYTNSAVNFFLYCIAGSKFRSDVRLLWKRYFKNNRKEHASVTHKSSSSE